MALIDEYKQAIQDVLDGRAPAAPKPSELPWTEDKAATMWAAAAAELIAEAAIPEPELPDAPGADGTYNLQNAVEGGESTLSWASGGSSGGGVLVVHDVEGTLDKTWQEIHDADFAVLKDLAEATWCITGAVEDEGDYLVGFYTYGSDARTYIASSPSGYPSYTA